MLRDPTGRPDPAAFVAGCGPLLMDVSIAPNARLLWDIFNHAAAGRAEAIRDDFDKREAKRKTK